MPKGKPLTDKQKLDIEAHSANGLTTREIGDLLDLGWSTVAHHLQSVEAATKAANPITVDDRVLKLLESKKKRWSIVELTDTLNVGVTGVREAIERLRANGKNMLVTDDAVEATHLIPKSDPQVIDVSKFKGKKYLFGVTADNHLGSKYARMDVLNALYDIWAEQGVTDVYQCGNMIDGEARFNKFDLLVHGMQGQIDYFIDNWPRRDGITTHYVTGDDHEGWYIQREGINIGQYMDLCAQKAGREDLHYLGHMEADVEFKGSDNSTIMRVIHAGGGTAYAISYKTQKIVESYQGGEKPHILLVGHYHKFDWAFPREVNAIQVGCTEDQTPFMRKLNIQAMIGGVTLGFEVDKLGFGHDYMVKWNPFYDRGFYKNADGTGGKWYYGFNNKLVTNREKLSIKSVK